MDARIKVSVYMDLVTPGLSGTFINREILFRTELFNVFELALEPFEFEKLFVVHL